MLISTSFSSFYIHTSLWSHFDDTDAVSMRVCCSLSFGPPNLNFFSFPFAFLMGVWWIVLVVSGDLTCSLARVQIFTLGMRMVQFRATVILNGKVAGCFIWGRFVGATAVVRGWRRSLVIVSECVFVCVCVKSGSRNVVSHCMFLLFPQMRNPVFGSCTARQSGEPPFLMVGGQRSRTVLPGQRNSMRHRFRKACVYTRTISFSILFPRWKIINKKTKMHISETVDLITSVSLSWRKINWWL